MIEEQLQAIAKASSALRFCRDNWEWYSDEAKRELTCIAGTLSQIEAEAYASERKGQSTTEEQIRAIVRDEIERSKAPTPKPAVLSEGYRFLRELEITQVGDQVWCGFSCKWLPCRPQTQLDKKQVRQYQRKLTPSEIGEGWRLLGKNELVVEGDMFLDSYGDWEFVSPDYNDGKQDANYPYRRRIEPETEPDPGEGWRLVDKEKDFPEKGDEIWSRSGNHWFERGYYDLPFDRDHFYRRRIEPKYREPTNADIGQMVEVRESAETGVWAPGKLVCVLDDSYDECYVVEITGDYFTWGEARIQEPAK